MRKYLALLALAVALPLHATAGNLNNLGSLSAAEFRDASRDLGAALSYKPLLPTEGQGLTGFDIGVAVTGSGLSRSGAALTRAGANLAGGDTLATARVHVHKGLPLGFDLGGFVASVPALGGTLSGAELRYALLGGGVTTPAIGVRGAYTRLHGVDTLALDTRSVDISISKGLALFTPYAGVGRVWVDSTARVGGLGHQGANLGKVYAGLNVGLGLMNLAFEADKTGEVTTWGVKLGLRW
jgi:hypothetical protein